jgi:hypothetical protein
MADFVRNNDNFQSRQMPPQKISLKRKTKEWREKNVDYVIRMSATANPWCNNPHRISNYQDNVDAYEGVFDEDDLKYITNPFNVEDGLPARLKDYNLVRPLVDSMIGEEVNRPVKFSVTRTSEEANNQFQQKLMEMLQQFYYGMLMSSLDPNEAQQYEEGLKNGQVQQPEEIARWAQESYKDVAEDFCSHMLKYLIQKLDLRTTFLRGYKDLILNREEIYYVGEEYGHPTVRWVNPATFCYEYSPDMMYIDDCSWCSERMIVSYAELHDRFNQDLTESDLDKILDQLDGTGTSGSRLNSDPYQMGAYHEDRHFFSTTGLQWPFQVMSADCIEVWKVHWKSFRKIYFITLNDPATNHPVTEVVDEDYVFTGEEEDVQEDWIMQVWQGYRVGGDIYFGIRPISAAIDHDDPTSITMPYTGMAAQGKSIMELLKPINITYLSLWYRLELMLARDNGRVLNMDVTQIPKSMGIDIPRWAHMLKAMGVNLVNPYEDSWNVPGRDGSRPSAFNAFTSIDLSMSQSIGMYIDLLHEAEQMAMNVIGFNQQRLGQVGHRDLAGTTQEALQQSYNTNALIVWLHDKVKERTLRKLLNVAIAIRYRNDEKFLSYVGTDGMKVFSKMPQTALESMDLFVTSSAEEQRKLEELKQLYQPAMQNGATLVDVLHMMESENITDIRLKLQEIEARKQQMMQQQEQQQQEMQQAQFQQVETDRQINLDKANADRTLKKYEADLKAQTEIQIAQLNAETKQMEIDSRAQDNPVELEKLELEKMKLQAEMENKNAINELAMQKMEQDVELKQQDLEAKQQALTGQLAGKIQDSDSKRMIEYRKLELEQKRLEIERDKMEAEIKKLRLEHELAMKELRAEFANQLKMYKLEEKQEVKMAKLEEAKDIKLTKLEQDHETKIEKMGHQHETKVKKLDTEGKRKIEQMGIDEERRKERKAEEKAAKAAREKKKTSSGGSSSNNSGSSSSGSSSNNNKNSNNNSNNTQSPSNGPQITITRIGL